MLAVRKNGFDGRILLATPPDSELRIVGANSLEPGMNEGVFTLVSQHWRKPDAVARKVRILGFAPGMRREAHPVDEAMQAFAYTHLVPAERMLAMQNWGAENSARYSPVDQFQVVRLVPGGKATLELWKRPAAEREEEYALVDPPAGVTLAGKSEAEGMLVLTLQAAENAAPGKYNLILRVTCRYRNKKGKKVVERFLLPAIRMEVEKCPAK